MHAARPSGVLFRQPARPISFPVAPSHQSSFFAEPQTGTVRVGPSQLRRGSLGPPARLPVPAGAVSGENPESSRRQGCPTTGIPLQPPPDKYLRADSSRPQPPEDMPPRRDNGRTLLPWPPTRRPSSFFSASRLDFLPNRPERFLRSIRMYGNDSSRFLNPSGSASMRADRDLRDRARRCRNPLRGHR